MIALLSGRSSIAKTLILDCYFLPELGAGWDADLLLLTIYCSYRLFAPQNSVQRRNLKLGLHVVPFTHKFSMFPHTNLYQQIPIKITLLAQLYRIPITNPLRYDHLLLHILILNSTTPATGTKLLYFCPLSITRVTRGLHHKGSLTHRLRSCPITRVALGWVSSWFAFAALAGLAFDSTGVLDRLNLVE